MSNALYFKNCYLLTPSCILILMSIGVIINQINNIVPQLLLPGTYLLVLALTKIPGYKKFLLGVLSLTIFWIGSFYASTENLLFHPSTEVTSLSGIVRNVSKSSIELVFAKLGSQLPTQRVFVKQTHSLPTPPKYTSITIHGTFSIQRYYTHNVLLTLENVLEVTIGNQSLSRVIEYSSNQISDTSQKYLGTNSGVAKAMVFGIRDELDTETQNSFRRLGLSHVLVASGANIILILSLIEKVCCGLRGKYRRIVEFLLVTSYILLVGLEGSITRAFFFFCINFLSRFIGRDIGYIQKILVTICLTGFLFPSFITSLSFLLSLTATVAIAFGTTITKSLNLHSRLLETCIINSTIIILVNVLIAHYFKTFNISGFVTNMLLLPLVEAIVLYGFSFLIIFMFISGIPGIEPLGHIVAIPLKYGIALFDAMIRWFEALFGYHTSIRLEISLFQLVVIYIFTGICWILMDRRLYKRKLTTVSQ